MTAMTPATLHDTLQAVFQLSRANRPLDATRLARRVGITPTLAARALLALERAGLVDASRARLTMRGLAVSARQQALLGAPRTRARRPARASRGATLLPRPAAAPLPDPERGHPGDPVVVAAGAGG